RDRFLQKSNESAVLLEHAGLVDLARVVVPVEQVTGPSHDLGGSETDHAAPRPLDANASSHLAWGLALREGGDQDSAEYQLHKSPPGRNRPTSLVSLAAERDQCNGKYASTISWRPNSGGISDSGMEFSGALAAC